jgi:uncharacterized protein
VRRLAPDDGVAPQGRGDEETSVYVGALTLDLVLGDVRSLKQKRSVVRPILAELRRRFEVAAAESGHQELHRRTMLGIAVVATDRRHCVEVLDACERLVADRPEVELVSARQQFLSDTDD